jgi:hypothetical protein
MSGTNQPRIAPKGWTTEDDRRLFTLRDTEENSWAAIATTLNRTVSGCQQHYYLVKRQREGLNVHWDDLLDHTIIDGRRRGLTFKAISTEMNTAQLAIADRWNHLVRKKVVPEDVLAIWRRKDEVMWSEAEDRTILGLWVNGKEDEEIVKMVRFEGKSQTDVRNRRRELVGKGVPMYTEMLGVGGGKKQEMGGNGEEKVKSGISGLNGNGEVKGGLGEMVGKKKYAWMG